MFLFLKPRRGITLEPKGILFMGMGISGGEEGARTGPSLMPGGPKEAYDELEPIISKCAAQVSIQINIIISLIHYIRVTIVVHIFINSLMYYL